MAEQPFPETLPVKPGAPAVSKAEERVSVASNWQLVWWRFRKNRLAVFSAAVLILFYIVVLFPDFFAVSDPQVTDARLTFIPVQRLHLFDGWRFSPWVPGIVGKRNAVTLRMEWVVDETVKNQVRFLVKGYEYKVLGLFKTD